MFHIENRKKVLHGRSKTVPHPKSGWLKISYFSLSIQTQVWFRNDRNYMNINNIYRGMQIRPRRFDSGFGLHLRKPRRSRSAGFFYGCAKGGCIPQNEAEGCRLVHKVIDERIIVSVITVGKQEHSAVYNQAKKR